MWIVIVVPWLLYFIEVLIAGAALGLSAGLIPHIFTALAYSITITYVLYGIIVCIIALADFKLYAIGAVIARIFRTYKFSFILYEFFLNRAADEVPDDFLRRIFYAFGFIILVMLWMAAFIPIIAVDLGVDVINYFLLVVQDEIDTKAGAIMLTIISWVLSYFGSVLFLSLIT